LPPSFWQRRNIWRKVTYNRRFAALRSFVRWLQDQSFMENDPLEGLRRRPLRPLPSRALNAESVEARLRTIQDTRDRALFWLIYEGGLRVNEALSLNFEDIDWTERSIRLHGKGDRFREMFFSRDVSKLLAKYLKTRGDPANGPLFVTHRKARAPRSADLSVDGYARLSYRQTDTRLQAVYARLGSPPAPAYGDQCPRRSQLYRSRSQAV
jgi:site-specific recombinase XerC